MNDTPESIRRKADDLARGEETDGEIYQLLHRLATRLENFPAPDAENGNIDRAGLKRHGIEYL